MGNPPASLYSSARGPGDGREGAAGHMEPSPLQVLSCPPICTNWAWGRRTGSLLRCLLHPSSLASTLSGVHCPSNSASPALSSFSRPLQASLCSQEQSYFLGKVKHTQKIVLCTSHLIQARAAVGGALRHGAVEDRGGLGLSQPPRAL